MLPAAVPLPAWLRSEGEVSARVSAKRRLRVRLAHLSGGRRIGRPLVHPRPQQESRFGLISCQLLVLFGSVVGVIGRFVPRITLRAQRPRRA